jgi:hypothetical protein
MARIFRLILRVLGLRANIHLFNVSHIAGYLKIPHRLYGIELLRYYNLYKNGSPFVILLTGAKEWAFPVRLFMLQRHLNSRHYGNPLRVTEVG